jgi:predicted DCC family thiol-disulfide oxidoreductase YuxK
MVETGSQAEVLDDARLEAIERAGPIVLYDGVCGLCSRLVQWILKHDPQGHFRFAALQSELGQALLERYDLPTDDLDTFVLVQDGEAYTRSRGGLQVAAGLQGPWRALSALRAVPRPLADWVYNRVAGNRYRIFGRSEACMLPPPEVRARFLG